MHTRDHTWSKEAQAKSEGPERADAAPVDVEAKVPEGREGSSAARGHETDTRTLEVQS